MKRSGVLQKVSDGAQFAIKPAEEGSAFVPWAGPDPTDISCVQEDRVADNDNTVGYHRLALQIRADKHRHHYVKCRVRVHEYPDGQLALFHGPRCLARYTATGEPIQTLSKVAA